MRLDESKCRYQTLSLFGDEPIAETASNKTPTPAPVPSTHRAEIYFDGGCKGNRVGQGQKYGSFEVLLDGQKILSRQRVELGLGSNNEAEFDSLKMALDEMVAWLRSKGLDLKTVSLMIETDSTIVRNRLMVKNKIFPRDPRSSVMFKMAEDCLQVLRQFAEYNVVWKGRQNNVERFGH